MPLWYLIHTVGFISIHAPPYGGATYIYHILTDGSIIYFNPRTCMGATLNLRPNRSKIRHFNPRTRVGCDHPNSKSCLNWLNYLFQSTHPCGVRRGVIARFVASLVLMQFQISHWLSNLITGPRNET